MNEEQVKDWEKTRAKGFDRYVISKTLLCGFGGLSIMVITDFIFDGTLKIERLGWRLIGYLIAGLILSWCVYEWNDYRYKNTIGEAE